MIPSRPFHLHVLWKLKWKVVCMLTLCFVSTKGKNQLNGQTERLIVRDLSAARRIEHQDELKLELELDSLEQRELELKSNVRFNNMQDDTPINSLDNVINMRDVTHPVPDALFLAPPENRRRRDLQDNTARRMYATPLDAHHSKALLPKRNRTASYRRKRKYQISKHLVVDILAVIDHSLYTKMYDKFDHITNEADREKNTLHYTKTYYGLVFAGIAQRYTAVNYKGMTILPRLAQILILTTPQNDYDIFKGVKVDNNTRPTINAQLALYNIGNWFMAARENRLYSNIDHVMVFTNKRMRQGGQDEHTRDKRFDIAGLTHSGQVCRDWQHSIIEDDLSLTVISTATHELAHNLGAPHDGPPTDCSIDDHFIMSPFVTDGQDNTYMNRYRFSDCSVEGIYSIMEKLNANHENCLADTPTLDEKVVELQRVVPGHLFDLHDQCQLYSGDVRSYYCGPTNEEHLTNYGCRKFLCLQKSYFRWQSSCRAIGSQHALYGTPCGTGRWCENGSCVQWPATAVTRELDKLYGECPIRDGPTCGYYINDDCNYSEKAKYCCNRCLRQSI